MNLSGLSKVVAPRKKRLGRGLGSGKGKTSARGQKGQKARGKIPAAAVGGGLILYKKLPYRRGYSRRGNNPTRSPKPVLVTTDQLNTLKAKSVVNLETLISSGFVDAKEAKKFGVKILTGKEELKVALRIEQVPVSAKVRQEVTKTGGEVVL